MKKALSLLFCMFLCYIGFSQQFLKNSNFEDWHLVGNTPCYDLNDWTTFKTNDTNNINGSNLVIRSSDRVSGLNSLKLKPRKQAIYNPAYPTQNIAFIEDTTTLLPKKIKGYYKFISDTFIKSAKISFGIWNDTAGSIPGNNVAGGYILFSPVTQWTAFEFNVDTVNGSIPPRFFYLYIYLTAFDTSSNPVGELYLDSFSVDFGTNAIQELPNNSCFSIYPNPTNCNFTIEYSFPGEAILTDLTGRILESYSLPMGRNKETINICNLAKGIYFVKFKQSDGLIATQKIIKQ